MPVDDQPIRVAVVDDSRSIRSWLKHVLNSDPRLQVVGEAASASEARALLRHCAVDVMTLDVEMPGLSGIEFLARLMVHKPMPVVMISSHTEAGGEAAIKALSLGAVDCVEKPHAAVQEWFGEDVCNRVFHAAHAEVHARRAVPAGAEGSIPLSRPEGVAWCGDVILLGASTGGVSVLEELMMELDGCPAPVVIVQHMPELFLKSFRQRLAGQLSRSFLLAREGLILGPGQGVLAMGKTVSTRLQRGRDGSLCCRLGPPSETAMYRPNVDDLFHSAAQSGCSGAAALLTGLGRDGAEGLRALRAAGFATFAQDERSSAVFGMPRAAVAIGAVQHSGTPSEIGRAIAALPFRKSIRRKEATE